MTAIVRKFSGETLGLLVALAILAVWALVAAYYAFVLDYGAEEGMSIALRPMWWVMFAAVVWKWVHVRRTRGRVLLDGGPLPQRWMFIVMFILFSIVVVMSWFRPSASSGSGGSLFAWPTNVIFCAILLMQVLQSRALFAEAGITAYGHLFPWKNVVAYRWFKGGELEVTMKGWSRLHEPLRIPANKRRAVEELLFQYAPMDDSA